MHPQIVGFVWRMQEAICVFKCILCEGYSMKCMNKLGMDGNPPFAFISCKLNLKEQIPADFESKTGETGLSTSLSKGHSH